MRQTEDIIMSFNKLGLSRPLLKAIASQGYKIPSPIQEKAIPAVLDGRDVMAAAQTGTGKTAGFTLPILQRLSVGRKAKSNQVRALILAPTRELAAQVDESVKDYGKHMSLSSTVVFGGVKINPQMMKLRRGVDVLVATPGRLMDLHSQNAVKFDYLEILVLDEADRMLDMGFIRDITKIISLLPRRRQNLMFSATFSDEIRKLANGLVRNPIEISVSPRNAAAPTVSQLVYTVDKKQKAPLLTSLIKGENWDQALVFTKTKHGANKLTKHLETQGIVAAAIHGNKSQGARTRALSNFKAGEIRILVATDIAARGLDIEQLPQVVNFDLPNVSEDYVHRIGRTGRAGLTGRAISLVSADEVDLLSAIERLIQRVLPRRELEGFEPDQAVKETTLNHPIYSKKPRKPLKSQTNESNNSRHRSDSNKRKRHSEYGQGPQPGKKAKRGGRNQAPKSDANSHNSVKYNSESGDGKSLERGFSPYGNSKKLENTNSGRRRPSGGNSNRGSGRARTR